MADTNLFKVNMICRNDLAANWVAKNPILAAGELGLETDTGLIKIGNGVQSWNNIVNYINPQVTDKQFEIQVYASDADLPDAADAKDNVLYIVPTTETYKYYVKQRMLHKEEKTREETVEVPIEETKDDSQTSSSETQGTSTETTTTDDTTTDSSTTETTSTDEKTETTDDSTTTEGDTSTAEGSTTEKEKPKTQTITKIVTYYEYYYAYDTISTLDLTNKIKTYEELTETTLYNLQSLAAELSQKAEALEIQSVSAQDQNTLKTALSQAKEIDSNFNSLTDLTSSTKNARDEAIAAKKEANIARDDAILATINANASAAAADAQASEAESQASAAKKQAESWEAFKTITVPEKINTTIDGRITNGNTSNCLWSGEVLNTMFTSIDNSISGITTATTKNVKTALGVYEEITIDKIDLNNSVYTIVCKDNKYLPCFKDDNYNALAGLSEKRYIGNTVSGTDKDSEWVKKSLSAYGTLESNWKTFIGKYIKRTNFLKNKFKNSKNAGLDYGSDPFNIELDLYFNKSYDRILIAGTGPYTEKNGIKSISDTNSKGPITVYGYCKGNDNNGEKNICFVKASPTQGYIELYNEYGYWWSSKVLGYTPDTRYSGTHETMGTEYLLQYPISIYPGIDHLTLSFNIAHEYKINIYGVPSNT